ncbi:MAG: Fic family protein [Niveispirillum sp.]|nr:Fic family protein [Niveispirillum sp.]
MPHRLTGNERYAGQMGLRHRFGLRVPEPFTISIVGAGQRRSHTQPTHQIERYPVSYDKGDDAISDLKFAIRYEPLELGLLKAAFRGMGPEPLEDWVRREPSGQFARRAWFLYEWLLGERLNLPDATIGKHVGVLDPALQIGLYGKPSRRHRIENNLIGTPALCPTVRVTANLKELQALNLSAQAKKLLADADPLMVLRAVNYIYSKETKSTFALEREDVQGSKADRFVAALQNRDNADIASEAGQTALNNLIIGDSRYTVTGWREEQNFVGENRLDGHNKVHFIPPRAEDVKSLMLGLKDLLRCHQLSKDLLYWTAEPKLSPDEREWLAPGPSPHVSPTVICALASFAFVFIHPFMDGNGRLHRFIIHDMLERLGFTPPGIIIPVSAVMLRDRRAYDEVLERFSASIMPYIDWHWRDDGKGGFEVAVENDTADLYRYFDATPQVEYLYRCIKEAIEVDLRNELTYVAQFDRGLRALNDLSAMPDRKAQLFVNLVISNGRIGADKRQRHFPELTDDEVERFEEAVRAAKEAATPPPDDPPPSGP